MSNLSRPERLSVGTKLAYGAGDLGFSVSYTIMGFLFLYFLTDVVGLSPALAGTAILIGKLWDGVVDPYLGHLTDRTVSRWGRRRVYFLYGFIPYGLTFALLWVAPAGAAVAAAPAGAAAGAAGLSSQALLFAWAAVVFVLHTTAASAVSVPYTCLTAELTTDYDERTSLTAYRMAFSILGGLLAAAVPMEIVKAFGGGRSGFMVMGAVFGAIIMISPLFPFFGTRERGEPQRDQFPLWTAVKTSLGNRAFQLALAVYLLTWTAMDIISAMFVYYLKYGLEMAEQTSVILGLVFGVAALSLPLWVWVSKKWSKRAAYTTGLSLLGGVLTAVTFLRPDTRGWAYPLAALAGLGVGAAHVVPWSIIPDVIEDDELRTGRRREGDFYGIMSFIHTLAASVAIFASGLALEVAGYLPDQPQGPAALLAIRLLLGPRPAALFFLGMVLLSFYPISRDEHARIRAELARRQALGRPPA